MANDKVSVELTLEEQQFLRSLKSVSRKVNQFGDEADKSFGKGLSTFKVFAANVGANVVSAGLGAIARGFSSIASSTIETAKNFEDAATQFEVLTGSAAQAQATIQELLEFSARTPFRFEQIQRAGKILLAFGTTTDELQGRLQNLGDIAAATGQDFAQIATVFGQVQAAGKLTGERLLQLQERGINVLPELAKNLGTTQTAVRDLVSQGKIDFQTFNEAIQSLTSEGGQFFQGLIKQSKTTSGVLSTLGDNFTLLANDIGQSFLPAIKNVALTLIEFVQTNRGLIKAFAVDFADAFVSVIGGAIKVFTDAIALSRVVFRTFVQGLVAGINAFNNISLSAKNAALSVAEFANAPASVVEGLKASIQQTKIAIAQNEEFSASLAKESGKIAQTQLKRRESIETATQGIRSAITNANKAIVASNDTVIKSQEKLSAEEQKQQELRVSRAEAERQFQILKNDEKVALELIQTEERFQRIAANIGREQAIRELAEIQRLEREEKFLEARVKLDELEKKSKISNIKSIQQFSELSDKQRLDNFKATAGFIANSALKENKKLFFITKAANISTSVIDGITAVQKALASLPFPANFVAAGLTGAAAAANTAKIASSKPPAFQTGGIVQGSTGSTDAITASLTRGEMVLNSRQQKNLFDFIKGGQQQQGGGMDMSGIVDAIMSQPIVVKIGENELARGVRDASRAGFKLA